MANRVLSIEHPLLAPEGRGALTVTVVVGIALYLVFGWSTAAPALPVLVYLCFHFRDPHRDSPSLPLGLLAPIDGRVSVASAAVDPWLGRAAVRVTMVMGLFDIHSLFGPTEGKIVEQWSTPRHLEGAESPPHHAIAYQIRTDEGDDVVLEIARGTFGGRLRVYYQPGERIGHARRIGYSTFGCRVTLYAAAEARLDCAPGDRVVAATSVVTTLVHDTPVSALSPSENQQESS